MFARLFIITSLLLSTCKMLAADSYNFINYGANHITMNGADWSNLRLAISILKADTSSVLKFNILQIGDSHTQGGFQSEQTRTILQNRYGNGGRGCLTPHKMIGTNQASDYTLSSPSKPIAKSKLLARNWTAKMGVTGVATKFANKNISLNIGTKHHDDDFSHITVLHAGGNGYTNASINGNAIDVDSSNPYASSLTLADNTNDISINIADADSEFWGAIVTNDKNGIVYNSIGNNGACYSHYNQIDDFATQTSTFEPQLIIISLGTNEAFGSCSEDYLFRQFDKFISSIKDANQSAQILLTTPMECDRRISTRTRSRHRKHRYSTSFATNTNCLKVRNAIMKYGEQNSIAVWDLYTVAGGKGSAAKWVGNSLLSSRDHVHCSVAGYKLQGSLLAKALIEEFEK